MIRIKVFNQGFFCANSYLIYDDEIMEGALVDPTVPYDVFREDSELVNVCIKYIFLTHCHFDHLSFYEEWREKTNALVVIGKNDAEALSLPSVNLSALFTGENKFYTPADILSNDCDAILLGKHNITILTTPGHTLGSICLLVDGNLFSGDTLFANGDIGRTDFPTGNEAMLIQSLTRLLAMNGQIVVYPGHGCSTTIAKERIYHEK